MIPYKDENPTVITPIVTAGLIVLNVGCWIFLQGMGMEPRLSRSVCELGLIPAEFLHRLPAGVAVPLSPGMTCVLGPTPTWYAPLTSMFLHGGWFHLLGNMLFLAVFRNNIEDAMGHGRYLVFYFSRAAAAARQLAAGPASGADGGASARQRRDGRVRVFCPLVRVHTIVFLGIPGDAGGAPPPT
jgi:membrane associated rhomboid family serine protease